MVLERTADEIIIRLPNTVDWDDLDKLLNFIKYKEIVSKSQATQAQIDEIASDMNKGWWDENKDRFLKP
jgi:hypothetical protein